GRRPASILRTGQPAALTLHTGGDWPHRPFAPGWLTPPDEAAGGTGVATPPCPAQQRNATARALHPRRSTPPTMRAETTAERRNYGAAPRQRWSAKSRHPLRPRQRRSVETTVCASLPRHSTVVSAVWAGQHCPSPPLPCVRIDWSAQSLAPASACGHASGRAPSHAQDHAKPTPVRLDK